MADSTALRVRRTRAHKAGDHSLCTRCSVVRGESGPQAPVAVLRPRPAKFDPQAEMRALAERLAAAHEAEPANALIARELRMTLAELMPKGAGKPDEDLTGLFEALQA